MRSFREGWASKGSVIPLASMIYPGGLIGGTGRGPGGCFRSMGRLMGEAETWDPSKGK